MGQMLILRNYYLYWGYFTSSTLSHAIISVCFERLFMNIKSINHFLISIIGLILASSVHATEVKLTNLYDFKADAAQAEEKNLPILLMFSASYCGFCAIVKEEFLKPMQISGDYTNKVIVRIVEIDSSENIIDIDGKDLEPEALAERYNVQLTPTLVFIDAKGVELAQKMVGVTTVDFYGGYLDEAIDRSLVQLRGGFQFSLNAN